jgi:hypothetical protein
MKNILFTMIFIMLFNCKFSVAVFVGNGPYQEIMKVRLNTGSSITCIANYIPDISPIADELHFIQKPEFADKSDYTYKGDAEQDGWSASIEETDKPKSVWISGNKMTNSEGYADWWWIYEIFFDYSNNSATDTVYIDTVMYNGDGGGDVPDGKIWRSSGVYDSGSDSWTWESLDVSADDVDYTNPVPEPASLVILSGGILFVFRRKR